ncbi:hypothetical protein OPV22_016243 [Ensete ventricosum]|uniref:Uncharacterized protein n=1 Tax=Ensete ventricosum TaxID=4639 RepID=A0AAV8QTC0_ENSVE|nr:hypothetical protein OPV22_016243 [Ensete ventricosum]
MMPCCPPIAAVTMGPRGNGMKCNFYAWTMVLELVTIRILTSALGKLRQVSAPLFTSEKDQHLQLQLAESTISQNCGNNRKKHTRCKCRHMLVKQDWKKVEDIVLNYFTIEETLHMFFLFGSLILFFTEREPKAERKIGSFPTALGVCNDGCICPGVPGFLHECQESLAVS